MVSNLNILCSDVVDQKRERRWLVALRKPCLLECPEKLPAFADARSALLELLLAASGIAQRQVGGMLCHAWGL